MRIHYIANIRLPTEKAHGIQVMKMCESFADQGVSVNLIVPTRVNLDIKERNPFKYYGVRSTFDITKVSSFDPIWLWKLGRGIYIKLQSAFFMLSLSLYLLFLREKEDIIFYTRDEYLLSLLLRFSKKVVWEGHSLPRRRNSYIRHWRKCFRIVAISNGLKKDLVGLGLDGNKIFGLKPWIWLVMIITAAGFVFPRIFF